MTVSPSGDVIQTEVMDEWLINTSISTHEEGEATSEKPETSARKDKHKRFLS